jgi:16S rRNA C1402 (ribose-2'-O) methylase RsmI
LTKAHEELVVRPISEVLPRLGNPRGEFTVVVDLGEEGESPELKAPSDLQLLSEIGEITKSSELSRRQALSALSRKHRLAPNEVYEAIERAKKLVK